MLHEAQVHLAWAHAATCCDCHYPIIDDEGNPGYQSEACLAGLPILQRLIELDSALLGMRLMASICNAHSDM
jgi:hypothetical protein